MIDLIPKFTKITNYRKEGEDSFTIDTEFNKETFPGQFVFVGIPEIGESPISIASYTPNSIKLHIRIVGNVTKALSKVRIGDLVTIRGPYGNGYPIKEYIGRDIVLIGGGCGVASIRSVADYLIKNRKHYGEVYMLLGFRNEKNIIFSYDFERWKNVFDLKISLDKVEKKDTCLSINVREGFVTELVKDIKLKKDTIAMMCGPEIMMKNTAKLLLKMGLMRSNIYVSMERLMYCGTGKCCHCMLDNGLLVCKHGPVFSIEEVGLR